MRKWGMAVQINKQHEVTGDLTEKELFLLTDALGLEAAAVKKYRHYQQELQDEHAKQLLAEMIDQHHRRFDIMLSALQYQEDVSRTAKMLLQDLGTQGGIHHGA
jgi:rubrerythrin